MNKVDRLLRKAEDGNDTVTVKAVEDNTVYFLTVKRYFDNLKNADRSIRLEALGSAITNLITVAHLLDSTGVAKVKKLKSKEKQVTYESPDGL